MAVTYSTALATDVHRVRFLMRDTDTSNAALQDEEITWILAEEPNIYFAAARAGELGYLADGKSISSISVGGLSIARGASPEEAYRAYLITLRKKGAKIQIEPTHIFEVL